MTATTRPGPNATLPCGTSSAVRRHLALAEACPTCGTEGRKVRRHLALAEACPTCGTEGRKVRR